MRTVSKEDFALAFIDRLIDNYEDKGDWTDEFYEIAELMAKAIAKSPDFSRIEEIVLTNGVIEEDYFN